MIKEFGARVIGEPWFTGSNTLGEFWKKVNHKKNTPLK